jgi:predicted Zn-dependent peptidase
MACTPHLQSGALDAPDDDTHLATLANGLRVLVIRTPRRQTVDLSVFVHTGSQHEAARDNGISHMVEHMAFKGTSGPLGERSCQRINLDAESLGAQVNAHTDKDHSAFHMVGLASDAQALLQLLADIVQHGSFPADELERERQVILHEFVEDEDDPLSVAFRLFDKLCWGSHPLAQPVIGQRRHIERFSRDELRAYVQRQYSAANTVVAVAGDVDPEAITRAADAAFGAMPGGSENRIDPPLYLGGLRTRALAGCPQTHVVLGFPLPSLSGSHQAGVVAAALLGEGMSSPLMDQLRERRGLVYYAACSADVLELAGQFVIEASTSPQQLQPFFAEVVRLLLEHAQAVDAAALRRARQQIAVRHLRELEKPSRRLETAVLDLFALGRLRGRAETFQGLQDVSADQVREAFAAMLRSGAAIGIAGKLPRGHDALLRQWVAPLRRS